MDGSSTQLPFCLSKLVGRRLSKVERVLYEYGGLIESHDGALELHADGHAVLLDGCGDGETLRVREGGWDDPFDGVLSDENREHVKEHGKWVKVDCSAQEGYSDLVGKRITSLSALRNEHGRIAGVRVSASMRSVWFVVDADKCRVSWHQPEGFVAAASS